MRVARVRLALEALDDDRIDARSFASTDAILAENFQWEVSVKRLNWRDV